MRKYIALSLAAILAASAQAQIFRPEAVNGAALGAVAGAIIGNNSGSLHHNAWKGAAIGAGAGLLLGAAIGDSHREAVHYRTQVPVPVYYPSYGYVRHYRPVYGVTYVSRPSYGDSYYYSRPSYAATGTVLGGIAGAIIGHNNSRHHNGWRGAAIGAGAGLLLGSILDASQRETVVERPVMIRDDNYVPAETPAKQAAPQQVTIINNYYGNSTPMSQANGLFGR